MGYDNQRKGWRCCDPTTGCCTTSRKVVFDEASWWWSSQKTALPDSKVIEEKLEQRLREHSKVKEKESSHKKESQEGFGEGEVDKSPKEERPNQLEDVVEEETLEPQLRRSKRARKPNPKYANAALIKGVSIKEPSTYEEA